MTPTKSPVISGFSAAEIIKFDAKLTDLLSKYGISITNQIDPNCISHNQMVTTYSSIIALQNQNLELRNQFSSSIKQLSSLYYIYKIDNIINFNLSSQVNKEIDISITIFLKILETENVVLLSDDFFDNFINLIGSLPVPINGQIIININDIIRLLKDKSTSIKVNKAQLQSLESSYIEKYQELTEWISQFKKIAKLIFENSNITDWKGRMGLTE